MTGLKPAPAAPIAIAPVAFTMLPGAGPVCEGDDCLPTAVVTQAPTAS